MAASTGHETGTRRLLCPCPRSCQRKAILLPISQRSRRVRRGDLLVGGHMASSVHRDPKPALADTRGLTLSARPRCAGHNPVAVCFHRKQDIDGPWPTTVWLTIFHSTEVCKRWTFIGSALCTLILVISQASDMRTVPSRECWAAAARAAPGQPRDYAGKRPTPHIPSRVTAGSAPLRLLLMVGMGRGAVTTAFAFPGLQSCRPSCPSCGIP